MQVIRRIDHIIKVVSDIRQTADRLNSLGFPVAWPIGPFWRNAKTCGYAIGGLNLELVQADPGFDPAFPDSTLVFEPTTISEARSRLMALKIPSGLSLKYETSEELLRLRGFDETSSKTKQLICTNLTPLNADFRFFFCSYSQFLAEHLSPEIPRLRGTPKVQLIEIDATEAGINLVEQFQLPTDLQIKFRTAEKQRIARIQMEDGSEPLTWLLEA